MVILYPFNQRFLLKRAHDITVMKTCHALAKRGHQVYLLMGRTASDGESVVRFYGLEPHPNLHLVQLPILRGEGLLRLSWHGVYNFFCVRAIRRLKKKVKPDLVYMREMKLLRFLLQKKAAIGLPFVYEVHGLYAPGYKQPVAFEGEAFRGCDVLGTTTDVLGEIVKKLYQSLPPLCKIPMATELPQSLPFLPPAANEPWRVCYIGQLYPLQGVDILIRALPHLPENVVVEIIGGSTEHIVELSGLATAEGVSQRVVFYGYVLPARVFELASEAHIFVAPSRAEKKMPFVAHTKIYEYFALGRPVVAADLPSVREEIEDGVNGVLFTPGSPADLALAIKKVMADRAAATRMAEKGKCDAQAFSWDARAQKLEHAFEMAVSGTST